MRMEVVSGLVALLVVANGTPFVLHFLLGDFLSRPLDGNRRCRDGRPLFGPNKTWRGVFGAVVATAAAAPLAGLEPAAGAAFGLLAIAGDLVSSFTKRRLDIAASRSAPLLDQLPESLLPVVVLQPLLGPTPAEIVAVVAVFTVIDLAFSWLRDFVHRYR